MIRRYLLPCAVVLALTGCKKGDAEPPPLPSTTAAPAPAAPTVSEPPTSEDFEQQAIDTINPQNLEAELDKLEKEIGQ